MVAPAARPTTKLGQPGNDVVKRTLPALLVPALLLLAAGAQAADESSSRREPPRIIFGQTEQTEFERSEEHTSALQSLMRISYAVFCLKKIQKTKHQKHKKTRT